MDIRLRKPVPYLSQLTPTKTCVRCTVNSGKIYGDQNDTGVGLSPSSIGFPLLIIIPPSPELCYKPDQAAHYHILGMSPYWLQSKKRSMGVV